MLRTPIQRTVGLSGAGVAVFLAIAHLAQDASTSVLNALLPSLRAGWGLSETALAALVAALSIGASVLQPLFGAWADRKGRRALVSLGLVVSAALVSVLAFAPNFSLLIPLLLVGGMGSAAFHPAAAGMIHLVREERRATAMSLFSAGGTIGVALGPIAVLLLVNAWGWRALPAFAIPVVAVAAAVPGMLRDEHNNNPAPPPRLFDFSLLRGRVGVLATVAMLTNTAQMAFTSGMPLWLVSSRGVAPDAPQIGALLAIFSLAGAAGGLVLAILSAQVSRRWLAAATISGSFFTLFGTLAVHPAGWIFWALAAASGFLANAAFPLLLLTAQEHARGAVSSAAGLVLGVAVGMSGLLYIGVGALQEAFGIEVALVIGWSGLLPAAGLALVGMRTEPASHPVVTPRAALARRRLPRLWIRRRGNHPPMANTMRRARVGHRLEARSFGHAPEPCSMCP